MARYTLGRLVGPTLLLLMGVLGLSEELVATDYFVTIGGGYVPEQNQASLEANVIFFQSVLGQVHSGKRSHDIFFSDGSDFQADLQILAAQQPSPLPATELLSSLHRRGGSSGPRVEYRNHRVSECSGSTAPRDIHTTISRIAKQAKTGDRLLIYVTAHGGEGTDDDLRDTTITCWNEQEITVREFSRWLDEISSDIPVILVMAQCYCGGFADTIFENPQTRRRLTPKTRIGFFAQQFDLPAAGCRPDIEHDQEFSSYFWGAMIGQSRNGEPMPGADVDKSDTVSFDEAFAHAVIVGETIDIPLKATDVLLRQFSRIPDYRLLSDRHRSESTRRPDDEPSDGEKTEVKPAPALPAKMSGPLREVLANASPPTRRIVVELGQQLELTLDNTVEEIFRAYEQHLLAPAGRPPQRGPGNRRGGRRELLAEVAEKWPELANPEDWTKSPLLKAENQQNLQDEIQKLPSYALYEQRRLDREEMAKQSERHELKEVKFRRLIDALENHVLAGNLSTAASPEIVDRFQTMLRLEQSSLGLP